MCDIIDNVIYLVKGDAAEIPVSLKNRTGQQYVMQPGDKLILTVRDRTGTDTTLRLKVESTTSTIYIDGSKSETIPVGQYSADIQFNPASGLTPYTIWPKYAGIDQGKIKQDQNWKNFWITPEVTENESD